MKVNPTFSDNEKEHVFRFKLNKADAGKSDNDPLVEMVRAFVADFLDIGCFTSEGKEVRVDGFIFSNDPEKQHAIFKNGVMETANAGTSFKE